MQHDHAAHAAAQKAPESPKPAEAKTDHAAMGHDTPKADAKVDHAAMGHDMPKADAAGMDHATMRCHSVRSWR